MKSGITSEPDAVPGLGWRCGPPATQCRKIPPLRGPTLYIVFVFTKKHLEKFRGACRMHDLKSFSDYSWKQTNKKILEGSDGTQKRLLASKFIYIMSSGLRFLTLE